MNSRAKGIRGELEWAAWWRDNIGFPSRRGQQFKGTPDSPDVTMPEGLHAEVRRREAIRLYEWVSKAQSERGEGQVAYLALRKNHCPWLITIRAEDLLPFCRAVLAAADEYGTP